MSKIVYKGKQLRTQHSEPASSCRGCYFDGMGSSCIDLVRRLNGQADTDITTCIDKSCIWVEDNGENNVHELVTQLQQQLDDVQRTFNQLKDMV
jgi:hypothetical protein